MAKTEFRAVVDGEGKVRFFVDGGAHTIDEYIAKYVKFHGTMPVIPVGLGGAAASEKAELTKKEEELMPRIEALEAKLAAQGTTFGDVKIAIANRPNNDGDADGA